MAGTKLGGDDVVVVGDVEVDAPGLAGTVTVERPERGRATRGMARPTSIDQALESVGMDVDQRIRIEGVRDLGGPTSGPTTRGARRAQATPTMTVRVPAPPAGREQVVLARDEHGIATWHFAGTKKARATTRGGGRVREYQIERRTAPPTTTARTRGGIPGLSKIVDVISFPVAEGIGRAARFAVREWDQKNHPSLIRSYGTTGALTDLTDNAWADLGKGPTLLFVHGTFSSTTGGFGRLPRATRTALADRYGKRVIAFDHPTIADDPISNGRAFLETAGDRKLELDIVCHSRGGLVARSIAERPGDLAGLAPNVSVRSIVLVGVPSNGTILADANHWNELVDRVTTLMGLIPMPGAVETLETVFALVRSIAVHTANNLKGLEAMAPGSDFLKTLNVKTADPGRYRALVSNFEPRNPGWKEWLNDATRDQIFDNADNDMMVPIPSMTGKNGSSRFPVTETSAFGPADAVEHSDYFQQDRTQEALLRWLTG
jgi:pimeloyl-ACP methyl ester carboxylesterase